MEPMGIAAEATPAGPPEKRADYNTFLPPGLIKAEGFGAFRPSKNPLRKGMAR